MSSHRRQAPQQTPEAAPACDASPGLFGPMLNPLTPMQNTVGNQGLLQLLPRFKEGKRPGGTKADGSPSGPYAFADHSKPGTLEAGAGVLNHEFENGAKLEAFHADLSVGTWGPEGQRRTGAKGEAVTVGARTPETFPIGLSGKGPSASFEASSGEDGMTCSAEASLASVDLRAGMTTPERNNDLESHISAGVGVGRTYGLHHGDTDGDGYNEYGVQATVGPLGVDVKDEDPLRTAWSMAMGPHALAARTLGLSPFPDVNVTHEAVGAAESAAGAVADGATSLWDNTLGRL